MSLPEGFLELYAGADRQGPGTTSDVVWALNESGLSGRIKVLDAGCGTGADSWTLAQALPEAQIALVFGREDSGLTSDELQRCQYHVHIPSMPDFSSLNLAAAVQVLAYELRMQGLQREGAPTKMHKVETTAVFNEIPATAGELEQFYQHLEQVLVEIGFHDPQKPRQLLPRLRRLYGRVHLNRMEMNILRGILTETQKAIGVKAAGERRS